MVRLKHHGYRVATGGSNCRTPVPMPCMQSRPRVCDRGHVYATMAPGNRLRSWSSVDLALGDFRSAFQCVGER